MVVKTDSTTENVFFATALPSSKKFDAERLGPSFIKSIIYQYQLTIIAVERCLDKQEKNESIPTNRPFGKIVC